MRFKQFLTEGSSISNLNDNLHFIYDNCQPFLKDLLKVPFKKHDNLLYRGNTSSNKVLKKSVRQDRRPTDTPIEYHDILNKHFKEKFGINARSQTVFCTANYSIATEYGHYCHIIFPINKYKVIWSPKHKDLYTDVNKVVTALKDEYYVRDYDIYKIYGDKNSEYFDKEKHNSMIKNNQEELNEKIDDVLNHYVNHYQEGNLKKAIESKNEVMLYTKQYIGLSYSYYFEPLTKYFEMFGKKYPTDERIEILTDKWNFNDEI
jgi:hypothetical protein